MINILVADDNFNYLKNLVNIISDNNPNVRLYNFCTNGQEVIDLLKNHQDNIDIILLDLNLPVCNGIEILNYIEENNLTKYKSSIIIISGEIELILKIRNNSYLYTAINKINGFDKILTELNKLICIKEEEKNSIEYKIYEELKKLNYNFSYVGTRYLKEALLLLNESNNLENIKLEKDIYPIISKKHKKSINNIKTNIINASDLMYYDCEAETLKEYFKIIDGEKPTPKTIIITILDKIKYSLK